jgi:caa(3)-type oxidase subunit IV
MSHDPHAAPAQAAALHASDDHAHHGHVIVSQRTLLSVLGLLMFFTLLTVGLAKTEVWIQEVFRVDLPQWVNVVVALSIAAVKSTVVAAYFMQLRYDNPLNTIIAVFTIFVLAFFLGFTMIDLGARGAIYSYKGQYIVPGGTGNVTVMEGGELKPIDKSITAYAREKAIKEIEQLRAEGKPLPKRLQKFADSLAHGSHGPHKFSDVHYTESGPNASRPRTGVTFAELMPPGAKPAEGHTAPHAPAAPPAH